MIIGVRSIIEITNSAVCATTINIMIYLGISATDGNLGVFQDSTATHNVGVSATTTIDITHRGSAKLFITHFGFADFTTADSHIRFAIYAGYLATAIDACQHLATLHVDFSISMDKASHELRVVIFSIGIVCSIKGLNGATIATTIHTTEGVLRDTAAILYLSTDLGGICVLNDYLCITTFNCISIDIRLHGTQLATTIHITLNSTALDGQLGLFYTSHFPPVYGRDRRFAIQLVESTHTTCKDVTALGML